MKIKIDIYSASTTIHIKINDIIWEQYDELLMLLEKYIEKLPDAKLEKEDKD